MQSAHRDVVLYGTDDSGLYTGLMTPNGDPLPGVVTGTAVTTGLQAAPFPVYVNYSPTSAPSQTIYFAHIDKMTYTSSSSNSGAGHTGATLSWYVQSGTGNPSLAIAHEAKFENNAAGTITSAKCVEAQLSANAGTITAWYGVTGQIVGNAGTVTLAIGNNSYVSANTGTISVWYGYYHGDLSGISGITLKRAFVNDDAAAPITSKAPIVDSAMSLQTPDNAFTITIGANISALLLTPVGVLATGTINMPAAPLNGQRVTISTTQTITALTMSGNGNTLAGALTTLTPDAPGRWQYNTAATTWFRI